jgi:hypothetical protein
MDQSAVELAPSVREWSANGARYIRAEFFTEGDLGLDLRFDTRGPVIRAVMTHGPAAIVTAIQPGCRLVQIQTDTTVGLPLRQLRELVQRMGSQPRSAESPLVLYFEAAGAESADNDTDNQRKPQSEPELGPDLETELEWEPGWERERVTVAPMPAPQPVPAEPAGARARARARGAAAAAGAGAAAAPHLRQRFETRQATPPSTPPASPESPTGAPRGGGGDGDAGDVAKPLNADADAGQLVATAGGEKEPQFAAGQSVQVANRPAAEWVVVEAAGPGLTLRLVGGGAGGELSMIFPQAAVRHAASPPAWPADAADAGRAALSRHSRWIASRRQGEAGHAWETRLQMLDANRRAKAAKAALAEAEQRDLGGGWTKVIPAGHERLYYWHEATDEMQYRPPGNAGDPDHDSSSSEAEGSSVTWSRDDSSGHEMQPAFALAKPVVAER